MDPSILFPLISRWAHIGSAILLVGGTAFTWLVLIPSLQGESPELMGKIRTRWKRFVPIAITVFLLSGFYNYLQMIPLHQGDGLYHMLVGTKIILALVVFFFASALAGSKPGTQKFRDNAKKWTGISLLIATVIVGISGFVKVRGTPGGSRDTRPVPATGLDDAPAVGESETR